jgi:hypothetical protein
MGSARVGGKVLDVLNRKRGSDVTCEEISRATDLTRGQVQAAVNGLIKRQELPITVVLRGQAWRYETDDVRPKVSKPTSAKTDDLFERIGSTQNGDVIVKGIETEALYRVVRL